MSRLGSFSPPTENAHHEAGSDNRRERINAKNRLVTKITFKKKSTHIQINKRTEIAPLLLNSSVLSVGRTILWNYPEKPASQFVTSQHLALLTVRILSGTECLVGDFAHLHWSANKQLVPENLGPDPPETWVMGRNSLKWLTLWTIQPKTCRASVLCCVTWLRDRWKSSCRE